MASTFSAQLAVHAVGVGWAADALAAAVMIAALGRDVIEVGSDMRDFVMGAINTRTEGDLEEAAKRLADGLTTAAGDVGMIAGASVVRGAGKKAAEWAK